MWSGFLPASPWTLIEIESFVREDDGVADPLEAQEYLFAVHKDRRDLLLNLLRVARARA